MVWLGAFLLLIVVYTKRVDFDSPTSYALWCATILVVMVALALWGLSYGMVIEQYPILDIFLSKTGG